MKPRAVVSLWELDCFARLETTAHWRAGRSMPWRTGASCRWGGCCVGRSVRRGTQRSLRLA